MDTESCSKRMSKSRRGEGERNCRRVWNKIEEEELLNALHELCSIGWKQENATFRPVYLLELENQLTQKFVRTDLRATPHIESKIKVWKQKYNNISSIMGKSGIGWNETTKTIDCPDDSVWELFVKRDPNLNGARHKPIQYYDQWCTIFGKDRATGEMAEGFTDSVNAMEQEEIGTQHDNDVPNFTTFDDINITPNVVQTTNQRNELRQGVRKRQRETDMMATGLDNITKVLNNFCEQSEKKMDLLCKRIGHEHDVSDARKKVYGEIYKFNLEKNDKFKATSLILEDVAKLDMFFSLPDEEKESYVNFLLSTQA